MLFDGDLSHTVPGRPGVENGEGVRTGVHHNPHGVVAVQQRSPSRSDRDCSWRSTHGRSRRPGSDDFVLRQFVFGQDLLEFRKRPCQVDHGWRVVVEEPLHLFRHL